MRQRQREEGEGNADVEQAFEWEEGMVRHAERPNRAGQRKRRQRTPMARGRRKKQKQGHRNDQNGNDDSAQYQRHARNSQVRDGLADANEVADRVGNRPGDVLQLPRS